MNGVEWWFRFKVAWKWFRLPPKDDPKRRCPNTTKPEGLVGWKLKVNLEEGLKRTVKWFVPKNTVHGLNGKNGEIRINLSDPNYAESPFPYQFSSVQITRSRKHLALNTLNIGEI